MKILLVNPPRSPENSILKYAPENAKHFIHKKLIGPPLGLLSIAAAVSDHDVRVIDLKGEYDLNPESPDHKELVTGYLRDFQPDIVGVTFIASEFYSGIEILETARKFNSEILTVAGGLHAVLCPDDFNHPAVDIVYTSHCASVFRNIVETREKYLDLDSIGGIVINSGNGLRATAAKIQSCEPAGKDFVMPDRSHLQRWISTYRVGDSPYPSTYIFTSLGCPYKCSFCSIWPQYNGNYHQRNVESIIEELQNVDDYKVVRFADANTIVNEKFISRLFDRIIEEKIEKTYIMDIRFDTAVKYPHLIEKLARGGLKVVICGFESHRENELDEYNKNASPRLIEEAIKIFHQNEIMLRGNYIVQPDYTQDDFRALAEYAGRHPVVYAGYTILTPMPGTSLYYDMKERIVDHDLAKYNFFNCVLETKLPLEQFYEEVGRLWLIRKGTDMI